MRNNFNLFLLLVLLFSLISSYESKSKGIFNTPRKRYSQSETTAAAAVLLQSTGQSTENTENTVSIESTENMNKNSIEQELSSFFPSLSSSLSSTSTLNHEEILRLFLNDLFDFLEEIFINSREDDENITLKLQEFIDQMEQFIPFPTEMKGIIETDLKSMKQEDIQQRIQEMILIGRNSTDEIIRIFSNPMELMSQMETFLSPEIIQQLSKNFPQGILEIKQILNQYFDLDEEEFDRVMNPFQDLFTQLSQQLSTETETETIISSRSSSSSSIEDSSAPSFEEITEESMIDMLNMFNDPKQIEEFRQIIIKNPALAQQMFGIEEETLARSEAFANYMKSFASEISSIMDPSPSKPSKKKSAKKQTKKSKQTIHSSSLGE